MAEPQKRRRKIGDFKKGGGDNIYPRNHFWYRNAWGAVEKLHESQSQTSTPPSMEPEHSAFLSALRSSMLEKGRIKQSEINLLYELVRRYKP
ncbi:MAG: hypothetical protein AABX01_07935 [Candidatus Micrarchaeota archaeon]